MPVLQEAVFANGGHVTFSDNTIAGTSAPIGETLKSLSAQHLVVVAKHDPSFLFEHLPHLVVRYNKEWCIKFKPDWMIDNYTLLMCEANPQLVALRDPEKLARINYDRLVEYNPLWVVKHQTERLAYSHPEILNQYDREIYEMATAPVVKNGLLNRLIQFTFGWMWKSKAKKEMLPDVILPPQVVAKIRELQKSNASTVPGEKVPGATMLA